MNFYLVVNNPGFFLFKLINKNKISGVTIVYLIPQVSRIIAYIFNYKSHVHDNMLCITFIKQDSINLAEMRIF
jgi:hypothetical protein